MPTPLTDADKVLRNDTGIDIATNIASIASALTPSNITDLGDVNLTNPITDGQVIKYDTATQKWVNGLGNITMECTQAQYDAWKQSGQLKTNTLYVITDAPNLNATANDLSMGSAPYASGTVGEFVATPLNTDITFTLKSGAKFTVTSFVGKKVGIVNILNLKLTPTEATATGTEIEVGNFANIYTYGSGTYYTGVMVDDQTKLVGSYLMTLGNQKLYLKFTDSTTRAIALTIVAFSA